MSSIRLDLFVFNKNVDVTETLLYPTLCRPGSHFTNPKLVDFPIFIKNTFMVFPAIVNGEDVEKVNSVVAKIQDTDENDSEAIKKLRIAIALLPIRLFVRALFKDFVFDLLTTNGDITTITRKLGGEFAENLRNLLPYSEVTASELQDAITRAAGGKRIVAVADGFARNSRGRKYQLLKYDLE